MPPARGLVRAMLVIAGAQGGVILMAVLRHKAVALTMGPAGIALLGLFTTLHQSAHQLAGLGLASGAVREIAAAREAPARLARLRRVLLWASLAQGGLAMAALWVWRAPLAVLVFDDPGRAGDVALTGLAVLLGLIALAQAALLRGFGRIDDLGRVMVVGAVLGTLIGLATVLAGGALVWLVVLHQAGLVAVGTVAVLRLPRPVPAPAGFARLLADWRPMAAVGLAVMLAALAVSATQLLLRALILREMGAEAAGHVTAAWSVGMQYVGFVLGAMGADFFPRLSRLAGDRGAFTALILVQARVALALGGPVLLALIGVAPWAMALLYSDAFGPAAAILQWQVLGDVFKLAAWPLGFALIAAGRSRLYLAVEIVWCAAYLGTVVPGLGLFGLEAAGIGFLLACCAHLAVLTLATAHVAGFRWAPDLVRMMLGHAVLAALVLGLARVAPLAGAALGLGLAGLTGIAGLRLVLGLTGIEGRLASRLAAVYAWAGWPVVPN